jgi:hypothetical protein
MYLKIMILIFLILPLPLLATPCNQATQRVIQAYDLGEHPNVYARQKALLQQALSLCPHHADAHNNLGVILENEQNTQKLSITTNAPYKSIPITTKPGLVWAMSIINRDNFP